MPERFVPTLSQMHEVLYSYPSRLSDIGQGVLRAAVARVQAARTPEERRKAVEALEHDRMMVVCWALGREAAAARRAAAAR